MKIETKVGLLGAGAMAFVALFAYYLGLIDPFSGGRELKVMYNYAGGIEEGSPVRVMGIKVGKVKRITFLPGHKSPQGELVQLEVLISMSASAWPSVRKDSQFFINLAGVIGEKFLEISPGSPDQPELANHQEVRGEDPPRIDQLISQSYGLAGKVIDLLEKNKGSLTSTIAQLDRLVTNFNRTLVMLEQARSNKEVARLIDNTVKISDDLAYLTGKLRSQKAEATYDLVQKLLFRLEPLDGPVIRKFLQEEGIRAKIL
jgi:phospholipid/cholesterol/gamma-HCH transport system substrate-binding protein